MRTNRVHRLIFSLSRSNPFVMTSPPGADAGLNRAATAAALTPYIHTPDLTPSINPRPRRSSYDHVKECNTSNPLEAEGSDDLA